MSKFVPSTAEKNLGSDTVNTLDKSKVAIHVLPATKKYTRKFPKMELAFVEGYDLLQFMIVVEPYIIKKFKMKDSLELKVLLYVFPMQYFTRGDFGLLKILRQHNVTIKSLIESDYFKIAVKFPTTNKTIYTLTDRAVKIVREYYSYLSGEKVIAINANSNPFKDEDAAKVDAEREKVMDKLRHQAEKNPSKFRRALY